MDNNYGSSLESALNCVRDSSPILTALWPSPFESTPKAADLTQIFLDISLNHTASRALTRLEGDQAQAVLDALQAILDSESAPRHQGNWNQHLRILCLLLRLAKLSSLYPRSVLLEGVTREGAHAITAGHFGEIWKGSFRGQSVCVKVLKVYQRGDINKLLKAFTREALLWNHMRHDNVLPFQGIHRLPGDEAGRIALISPWMENGNIGDYLARCPTPGRYALARDVCEGLAYLHKQDIIHGDLKGVNILVDSAGRARVADFGLSFIVQSEILRWTASTTAVSQGGTVRWQAPELFNPEMEDAKSTKLTDIYSLGCVFYEIFTGQIPFYEVQKEYTVISFVLSGKQPSKPLPGSKPFTDWGLTETFWTTCIEGCWNREPQGRPQLSEVLSSLSSQIGPAVLETFQEARDIKVNDQAVLYEHSSNGAGLLDEEEEIVKPSINVVGPDGEPVASHAGPPTTPPNIASLSEVIGTEPPVLRRGSTEEVSMEAGGGPRIPFRTRRMQPELPEWAVQPKVLLVDDDAITRKLASKFLQLYGCTTDVAVDGASAVMKMSANRYDLVLMDIVMPRMDGVTATTLIRKSNGVTPIIAMTSNTRPNDIMLYYSSGMNDVLAKPFSKKGLLDVLEKHLVHMKAMLGFPINVALPPGPVILPLPNLNAEKPAIHVASSKERLGASSSGANAIRELSIEPKGGVSSPSSRPSSRGQLDGEHNNPLAVMGLSEDQLNKILEDLANGGSLIDGMDEGAAPTSGLSSPEVYEQGGLQSNGGKMKRSLDGLGDGETSSQNKKGRFIAVE
ncbi:hypothetical protein D9611_008396 [Ephemerocybe angulata]|uniref:Uncharacterized protein n=1 Tax=Ephemerocybe angulata TaxID=980116 RepID=A0A8H5F4Z8_9AGAR|nr:hypothetical protein D9611_008396 [Tulosesus angulatus]